MSKRKDKKRGRGGKAGRRQPSAPGWGQVLLWFCVAGACGGSVWLSKALFEAPAGDFYRAINRVPWDSWDGHVVLGIGLTALIGAQALSMVVLGTYSVTRLVSEMSPRR